MGVQFVGLTIVGLHARKGVGWINVVTNQLKGRMGREKTRCGHVKEGRSHGRLGGGGLNPPPTSVEKPCQNDYIFFSFIVLRLQF
jgi:hypothetical protein